VSSQVGIAAHGVRAADKLGLGLLNQADHRSDAPIFIEIGLAAPRGGQPDRLRGVHVLDGSRCSTSGCG